LIVVIDSEKEVAICEYAGRFRQDRLQIVKGGYQIEQEEQH
jgi:hypothetical protein